MANTLQSEPGYFELRQHEVRRSRLLMIDGNVVTNSRVHEAGTSARSYRGGYWGFASVVGMSSADRARAIGMARANARAMGVFGVRESRPLPGDIYCGEHACNAGPALSARERVERADELHALCASRYPKLAATRIQLADEHHTKAVETSGGGFSMASTQRALCHITYIAQDDAGVPVELSHTLSGKGSLADLDLHPSAIEARLDALHEHLMAKCRAISVRGGLHTVVIAPELSGLLAHEAIGHPCQADVALGGAVTCGLLDQRVASTLISMVDFANTFQGAELMVPVYADDEGVPARDAQLIREGVLVGFMNNRATANEMGAQPTGNARAYRPSDEPLIRMRNTAILPGKDKLADIVEGVEDGYLLLKSSGCKADTTTEFMLGISLGYEIRGGKIGGAIRDTTLSGSAMKVLQSVDAVSDDMHWSCSGFCGERQPMIVSTGGPALRVRARLGGR